MSEVLLEVEKVSKKYRLYRRESDRLREIFGRKKLHTEFYANREISLKLHRGETLGIIGVNGAGKSTLLKMIAGVVDPTEGSIRKRGRVTALLELGTGFNPELSGLENIYYNALLIGMSREEVESSLEEIVAFSELGSFIEEPLRTYSSGMVMRLAFSIAIHSRPRILIVDEALSVGDAHFSAKCTAALNGLKQTDMGIIYVSHDLNSLKLLCDRILLLDAGRVIDEGDPERVVNHYNFRIAQLNEVSEKGTEVDWLDETTHGTGEATIEAVRFVSTRSHVARVASGEEAVLAIDLLAHSTIGNVSVGIMIRDRFGQDLYGTRSLDHGHRLHLEAGRRYRVLYRFDVDLAPGEYTCSVAAHHDPDGVNRRLVWRDRAAELEVTGFSGPRFVGLCRLRPEISVEALGSEGILWVTTSRSILAVDLATGRYAPLHRGRGLYYGLAVRDDRLYVAARGRKIISDIDPADERGSILVFDRSLRLVEELVPDFPLRDMHQIRWIGDRLHVTCTHDDMIAIYDGENWERWYPEGEGGCDRHHFNSLLPLSDGGLVVLAHNFGESEALVFDGEYRLRRRVKMGKAAHDLWHDESGRLLTLSSDESRMVDETGALRLPLDAFPRGIAPIPGGWAIGISERVERRERDFVDGRLLLFDRAWLPAGELRLEGEGMVNDLLADRDDPRSEGHGGFAPMPEALSRLFER